MTPTRAELLAISPVFTTITAWIAKHVEQSSHPNPDAVWELTNALKSLLLEQPTIEQVAHSLALEAFGRWEHVGPDMKDEYMRRARRIHARLYTPEDAT